MSNVKCHMSYVIYQMSYVLCQTICTAKKVVTEEIVPLTDLSRICILNELQNIFLEHSILGYFV